MVRIFAGLVTSLAGLTLVAVTPAQAENGWITDGEGGFYSLDTDTTVTSPVGLMSLPVGSLAAIGRSTMLGIQNGPGSEQHLVSVDVATGSTADRGLLDGVDMWDGLTATADGTLYVAAVGAGEGVPVYTVDPADGSMTPVGESRPGVAYPALAGACGGDLLGADAAGHLVKIDRTSGSSSMLGPMAPGGDPVVALAFDHAHRTLWAMTRNESGERLFRVDPATGTTTATSYAPGQIGAGPIGLAFDSPSACRYDRKVSLAYSDKGRKFTGRLTSSWQPCTSGQKVSVYRKVKGPDDKLGTVQTGSTGRFSLSKALTRGSAYAIAAKSSKPATGVCLAASSGLVR